MRQETINVYEYKELKPESQEKVINYFRSNNDYPFLEENITEAVADKLKEKKIKTVKDFRVMYNLGHSQGDGLCFIGTFKWKQYRVTIRHMSRYYHSNSTEIEILTTAYNDARQEVYDTFKEIYTEVCNSTEKAGYGFIDWEDGEETIKETIEANEYEFYSTGRIFNKAEA